MAALTGLLRPAGRRAFSMASRLLMQTTGQRLAKLALSSGQQMADRTGSVRRAEPKVFSGASPLRTQIMAQRLVATEPLSEQPMEGTLGLANQAGPPVPLLLFHSQRRTPVRQLVFV